MKNGIYKETFLGYKNTKVHYKDDIVFHVEFTDGTKYWYNEKGQLHKLSGPAAEFINGVKYWYLNNKYIPVYSQEDFERYLNTIAFR